MTLPQSDGHGNTTGVCPKVVSVCDSWAPVVARVLQCAQPPRPRQCTTTFMFLVRSISSIAVVTLKWLCLALVSTLLDRNVIPSRIGSRGACPKVLATDTSSVMFCYCIEWPLISFAPRSICPYDDCHMDDAQVGAMAYMNWQIDPSSPQHLSERKEGKVLAASSKNIQITDRVCHNITTPRQQCTLVVPNAVYSSPRPEVYLHCPGDWKPPESIPLRYALVAETMPHAACLFTTHLSCMEAVVFITRPRLDGCCLVYATFKRVGSVQ